MLQQALSLIAAYPDVALGLWLTTSALLYAVVPLWAKPLVAAAKRLGDEELAKLTEKK